MDVRRRKRRNGSGEPQNTVAQQLNATWVFYWGTGNTPTIIQVKRLYGSKELSVRGKAAASNIAITYRQRGNHRKAVQWFRKSVASGDDDALIQLGIHYYWGKGAQKNPTAAVRCFRKATKGKNISEAGRDDAFFYLGIAYLEGKGVRASIPTARKLFQRANVDNDHAAARCVLQELARS